MKHATLVIATIAALGCSAVHAQETRAQKDTERNVNQQERIEQGLKSGELTTHEAGRLERQEAQVQRIESRAERDGKVTKREQARVTTAENHASRAIARQKHDAQTGNPNSASSRRMQADVQRNANQQARIEQGLKSGELTNHEAARMERGQAHVERAEANAAANGRVGAAEQQHVQRVENRQSRRIHRQKHD